MVASCQLHAAFVVESRQRVKSWAYMWCRRQPLSVSFPSLFFIAESKEA